MEAIYDNHNFISVCEFLPNHLYFVTVQNINNGGSCDAIIPHTDDIHFFTTDNELVYHNFYGDFGPLNITCLYKFCKRLTNKLATYAGDTFYEKFTNSRFGRKDMALKLKEKFVKKKIVVYYTSTNNEKRANAAFLISSYAVLYLGFSPRLAYKVLQPTKMRYRPFQDASIGLSPYKINMKNCLDALHKASIFGFFNFNDFNASECNHYENIEHGDLNWIIPQKFIAFPGPVEEKNDYYHHPNFYIEYFLCNNVTDVIRLNQRAYDAKCFTIFNIKHHDLYMQDGTDPPESILKNFMRIAETASGAIAVHCKAGLGRTGSLIGAYLLKHYRMTAKEAIAWIRICRPGSVIGHQQTWLENHEEVLWYEGNEWRFKMYNKKEIVPFLQYGIYSYEAPKKEFPGLRELLSNLTKRSRYRFIVKNRSKKSKTKLQNVIKTLLENGKSTKPQMPDSLTEESAELAGGEQKLNGTSPPSLGDLNSSNSKNLHYLKPPPQIDKSSQPFNYEYSQQEYQKPPPENVTSKSQIFSGQRPIDQYTPSYIPYENKMPTMSSIPSSFYSNNLQNEYAQPSYEKRPNLNPTPQNQNYFNFNTSTIASDLSSSFQNAMPNHSFNTQTNINKPLEMPSIYSEPLPPSKFNKKSNLSSKSIDKNWKQNNSVPPRFYTPSSASIKKYQTKFTPSMNEEVCAFDSRVDTISQYSRFNKPFLNKGSYFDQSELSTSITDSDYFPESKLKGYASGKPPERSTHGFLLSPEDLQSWVETFDEKIEEALGEKKFHIKKSSVL